MTPVTDGDDEEELQKAFNMSLASEGLPSSPGRQSDAGLRHKGISNEGLSTQGKKGTENDNCQGGSGDSPEAKRSRGGAGAQPQSGRPGREGEMNSGSSMCQPPPTDIGSADFLEGAGSAPGSPLYMPGTSIRGTATGNALEPAKLSETLKAVAEALAKQGPEMGGGTERGLQQVAIDEAPIVESSRRAGLQSGTQSGRQESPDDRDKRIQRETRAAAAEKRMAAREGAGGRIPQASASRAPTVAAKAEVAPGADAIGGVQQRMQDPVFKGVNSEGRHGAEYTPAQANASGSGAHNRNTPPADRLIGTSVRIDTASDAAPKALVSSLSQQDPLPSASPNLSQIAQPVGSHKVGPSGGSFGGTASAVLPPSRQLTIVEANSLHNIVFGHSPSQQALARWTNQGFRFSNHPDTLWGLVQKEGGPCGVLAPVQAFVMKYLLFCKDPLDTQQQGQQQQHGDAGGGHANDEGTRAGSAQAVLKELACGEAERNRALVQALGETLWQAGGGRQAVIATIETSGVEAALQYGVDAPFDYQGSKEQEQAITSSLLGVSLASGSALRDAVRVRTASSLLALHALLQRLLPVFQSGFGALLLLFSAVLSRTLVGVQEDRDDPDQPLVTQPFGHAAQEVVNLLLCGHAVPNVFDGSMDLGEGMRLKGVPSAVQVGFLTLLESLNLCKVGQNLKNPKWPVWVVGSESHYTILFTDNLSVLVEEDNNAEAKREADIQRVFDEMDTSGGGGFITPDALRRLLTQMNIRMPDSMVADLTGLEIVVWNEFWLKLKQLDISLGGLKEPYSATPKEPAKPRCFEIWHFNGIAKYDMAHHGAGTAGSSTEASVQRPRFCRLQVSVPPKWTPDELYQTYPAQNPEAYNTGWEGTGFGDVLIDGVEESTNRKEGVTVAPGTPEREVPQAQSEAPQQHAQLVDCIRTRWQRATCRWTGDAPSIV
eukprot:TRINITY_DN35414_c0_g1_i1.p1 TRINITY_DN35414_c0_g1~~TRINITY_DN35414_c0_g1_i1.p1  ORF type:complete len:942 (+),score=155.08 TRINITY_DN35414_c0_g1_i1:354-3179(+)